MNAKAGEALSDGRSGATSEAGALPCQLSLPLSLSLSLSHTHTHTHTHTAWDQTSGLCLGPYGDPRGVSVSYERGTPVWRPARRVRRWVRSNAAKNPRLVFISHRMCQSNGFRKSTPPQNRQLDV